MKTQTKITKITRVPEILEQLGISRSTLFRFEKYDSTFPKKIKIGPRAMGWLEPEIDAWILSRRAQASDAAIKTEV
jgi:prophage regulatory protein